MFRREFTVGKSDCSCIVTITVRGFYDLFCNARKITKECFAPYISAPTELVYHDTYDITESLQNRKKTVSAFWLVSAFRMTSDGSTGSLTMRHGADMSGLLL